MTATLEQLAVQFSRLVEPVPTAAVVPGVAAVAATAPDLPASNGRAGLRPADPAARMAALPTPQAPAAPAPPPPIQTMDHSAKGYHLEVTVGPRQVVAAAEILDQNGFALDAITGVDWIAANEMEIVYDYFHPTAFLRVAVRARVPRGDPAAPTISAVFPGANWHERETHDFFGLRFAGHPNLTPFLLPEDADFHPLRKDYKP